MVHVAGDMNVTVTVYAHGGAIVPGGRIGLFEDDTFGDGPICRLFDDQRL